MKKQNRTWAATTGKSTGKSTTGQSWWGTGNSWFSSNIHASIIQSWIPVCIGVGVLLGFFLSGTTGWGKKWMGTTYQGWYSSSSETYNSNIDLQFSVRDSGATLGHRFFRFSAGSGSTFTLNGYTRDSYYEDGQTTYLFINSASNTNGGYTGTGTVVFNDMVIGYYEGCDDSTHMMLSLYNGTLKWNRNNTVHSILSTCYSNDGTSYWSSASTLSSDNGSVMTIADGGGNYYDGVINGSISFIKNGSGTQYFSNTGNSFSGDITINGGTIGFYCTNAGNSTVTTLGTNSSLYLSNGGQIFAYSGSDNTYTHTLNKNISINGTGSLRSGYSMNLLVSGAVTGNTLRIASESGSISLGNSNNSLSKIIIGTGTSNWDNAAAAARLLITRDNALGNAVIEFVRNPASSADNFLALQGHNAQISGLVANSSNTAATVKNNSGSAASTLTINTASGASYTYEGKLIDGSSQALNLVKSGAGTQVFTNGGSTYTGTTTISAGTLDIGLAGTLGTGTVTIQSGAMLKTRHKVNSGNGANPTVAGAGILRYDADENTTLFCTGLAAFDATNFTGTIVAGSNLRLNVQSTFENTYSASKFDICDTSQLWLNGADLIDAWQEISIAGIGWNGLGALCLSGASSITTLTGNDTMVRVTGNVVLNANSTIGVTYESVATTAMIAGNISGAYTLTLDGGSSAASTLILTGINSYGATNVAANKTLQVGHVGTVNGTAYDGTTGTLGSGNVTLNSGSRLRFSRSNDATVSSQITGSGSLEKAQAGTLTLTGTNTYSGTTTISGGTLQLGNGGTTGTIGAGNVTVASGATLAINHSANETFANQITGAGGFTKLGSNTLTLTGASDYSGTTTISGGTLQIGNGGTTGSIGTGTVSVASGASFAINHSADETFANQITGAGGFTKLGSNTLKLTGTSDYSGTTTVSGGTLQLGNGGTTGTIGAGNVSVASGATFALNHSADETFANQVTGAGAFTKLGSNTVTLTGSNTYTGATTISGGTLQIGNGGTSGTLGNSGAVTVASGATLKFNRSDALTVNNAISGGGNLEKVGANTVVLTGANTYTGSTTISAGTLQVGTGGAAGALGTGDLNIASGSTLEVNLSSDAPSANLTLVNKVTGSGRIVKKGTSTVTMTGNGSTFNYGEVIVNGGKLVVQTYLGEDSTGYVNGCTLEIGENGVLGSTTVDTGNVLVTGGTIDGDLTINDTTYTSEVSSGTITGDVTINSGATLNVSGGDLALVENNGNLTLTGGDIDTLEINDGSKTQITLSDPNSGYYVDELFLNDGAALVINMNGNLGQSQDYLLFAADTNMGGTAIESGNSFSSVTVHTKQGTVTYTGADVHQWVTVDESARTIVLHYSSDMVPEPSTWLLLALGVLGLSYVRSRKKPQNEGNRAAMP